MWTSHALQARVEKVWDETKDARTLTLRPGVNWRGYRAGQHLRIGVPIGGMHHTRTYTISSPPERDDGIIWCAMCRSERTCRLGSRMAIFTCRMRSL